MTDSGEPLRLFFAAALPTETQREIADLLARLSSDALPGWRWAAPATIHLTLRFLGETPPDRAPAAMAALQRAAAEAAPFRLALGNCGTFGGRRPRVLWLGLDGDLEALQALAGALNEELHCEGWKPPERPLRPHITLARAPSGARHSTVAEAALGGAVE